MAKRKLPKLRKRDNVDKTADNGRVNVVNMSHFKDLSIVNDRARNSKHATVDKRRLSSLTNESATVDTVVRSFLSTMTDEIGFDVLPFWVWRTSYDDLRKTHFPDWPDLSDKVLSKALVKAGCKRGYVNDRKAGGKGRYTTFEIVGGTP